MKSTLLQAWLSLLFVTMVAASAVPPKTSWKQATRSGIIARGERNRRLAGIRRQANPSCRSYPTCSQTARSGTNYCSLAGYDLAHIADIGGIQTYSNEQCVKACEGFSGCVASLWVPDRTPSIQSQTTNCLFKGNDFTSQSFSVNRNGNYILTLMGSCCDFESKFPSQGLPDACQDDGQRFSFPTCTGNRRTNSGAAKYAGIDLNTYADTKNPGYRLDTKWSGRAQDLKAYNLASCLGACDTFGSECKGATWVPNSANGDAISCYFKNSSYTSAPRGSNGYLNNTSADFVLRDTSCQAQAGQVPGIVSKYCCDDPVKAYPTCPSSTGDGWAYYRSWDNPYNDLAAYGPNKLIQTYAESAAACNNLCRQIGTGCLGTRYNPGAGRDAKCVFKSAEIRAANVNELNYSGGIYFIGGCSQYSSVMPSGADSICCDNN